MTVNVDTDAAIEAIAQVRDGLEKTAAALARLCEAAPHPVTSEMQESFGSFCRNFPLDQFEEKVRRLAEVY